MRFTALVINTTHNAVTSGARSGREHDHAGVEEVERHPEEVHDDAEPPQHARGEHLAGELRRRRHLDQVVERARREHHARAEQQADRLGVVDEHVAELVHVRRDRHRREEPDEHRGAAQVGVGFVCT